MDKFVLIDGNSLLNRTFYATPVFTTKDGMPTNAIFGFTKFLLKILKDNKPEYLLVAFDMKAPTFRHLLYDGYKAQRKGMPDELAAQVEPLKELLAAMNVAICQKEGIEADDILGTLSKKFDVHSYIYTGDRDSYQLVDEKTDVFYTKRGVSDILRLNIENFKEQTGLKPAQIVDLKALMGDKSDNIPGVPGIGEKTARGYLEQFETLDGVYENLDKLKPAVKEKLEQGKELAYLSYKLAKIDRNVDIDVDLSDCKAPKKFNGTVKRMFGDLEFNSLLELNIFEDDASAETPDIVYPPKVVCESYEEIAGVIKNNGEFSVALNNGSAAIFVAGKEYSLVMSGDLLSGSSLNYDAYSSILREIFCDSSKKVVVFDYKSILHELDELGIAACCDFDDVSVMAYLCDATALGISLKELLSHSLLNENFPAFGISVLFKRYAETVKSENMQKLYSDVEKPLVEVLFEMEKQGVIIGKRGLEELSAIYQSRIEEYQFKVFEASGRQFNLNSPMQLGEVLFNKFGITEVKKKKSDKFTTSADVLEGIADKYPVVGDVLKYRLFQKLKSTYIDGFRPLIDKKSRVHTTYKQTVTSTGRLSSTNPNLQNIPIRRDEGFEIRKIFVPDEGNVFIDADYSQIELRLLAHFSGCRELIDAYRHGEDIHSKTAAQVFGVELEDVTPQMRRAAKAVNFGIIYGISEFGLSKNIGVSVAEARGFIKKYFETYSDVKNYMDENVKFAKEHGYVTTLFGRKRYIPEIKSQNYNLRQFGERAAMNMPLQGTSADIIKVAMINVYKRLKESGLKAKLILQVHDELVIEAPENEAEEAGKILKEEMENAVALSVPLTVEVSSGKSWYDAK